MSVFPGLKMSFGLSLKNINSKMHDLCKTKPYKNGYKDINLLLRHEN